MLLIKVPQYIQQADTEIRILILCATNFNTKRKLFLYVQNFVQDFLYLPAQPYLKLC